MTIFFVGGIHGVGKSTLCRNLGKELGAEHLKASELIGYRPSPSDPTQKAVADVNSNQERLISALKRRKREGSKILLDGHFCVLSSSGRIIPIPVGTFRVVSPVALLFVEAKPDLVKKRLEQRENRPYDLDLIGRLAAAEHLHAEYISSELALPLMVCPADGGFAEALHFLAAFVREHDLRSRDS